MTILYSPIGLDKIRLDSFDVTRATYIGSSVTHIFIDLILWGIPVPLVWKLQMGISHKFVLIAIFALGSL